MEEHDVIINLLDDLLGEHKAHYPNKCQISYDCPNCSEIKGLDSGDGKGNLEISYSKHLFHCWSCGDYSKMHGPLGKLFDLYGDKKLKKLYNLIKPKDSEEITHFRKKIKLPEDFTLLSESNKRYPPYLEAINYLKSRGINEDIINKYKIGFAAKGEYKGRIIVPSYDSNNELNYYIGRSWNPRSRAKYKNPEAEKELIIFNEHLINWSEDIFLVEGVFDSFFLDNSIPLLGKHVSNILFESLYNKAKNNITICLDGDAFNNAIKLYHELNGGVLYGKIKLLKLPVDKDVCDLRGDINEFYYEIK